MPTFRAIVQATPTSEASLLPLPLTRPSQPSRSRTGYRSDRTFKGRPSEASPLPLPLTRPAQLPVAERATVPTARSRDARRKRRRARVHRSHPVAERATVPSERSRDAHRKRRRFRYRNHQRRKRRPLGLSPLSTIISLISPAIWKNCPRKGFTSGSSSPGGSISSRSSRASRNTGGR